jgi:hypothetical protein
MKSSTKRKVVEVAVAANTIIFLLISVIHFYWSAGGRLWYNDVLPTNSSGTEMLNPSAAASAAVAIGFVLFALITLGCKGMFDVYIKRSYWRYAALFIAVIFFVRAIGDFKFVGFFKEVNTTRFALNDSWIFSPLCLFVGLTSLAIFAFGKGDFRQPGS